jgi:2-deoxy-D-gluconate 3-dehydrogenase
MARANVLGLEGRTALVVGGGSGIGRATALLLGDAGVDVVVADMDKDRAATVQAEVEAKGVRASSATGDVTVEAEANEIVAQAFEFLGNRLDILINIVGMAAWVRLFELDDATWDLDMGRNLRQHLYVARSAARRMVDQGTGGRIALVASVSGIYGAPNHGTYGAAKAGVMALSRTMAQEWAPFGIRVNAVAPDCIATPRVKASMDAQNVDLAEVAKQSRLTLGRFGEPEEIAGPLVFLVSDLSSFMTGQTLLVDGGRRSAFPTGDPAGM